ncbi:signal peptidase II [bacterium]|nr:signal peptidase II [bacterium]
MSDDTPKTGSAWVSRAHLFGPAVVTVAVDQLTKALIVSRMSVGDSIPVLGPYLSLTRRTNTGGAFGILQGNAILLAVIGVSVICALAIVGPRVAGANRPVLWSFGLVLGGALGNLLDRVLLGHVVDFIDFHVWPVFNVADIGITCGAALLFLCLLLDSRVQEAADPGDGF